MDDEVGTGILSSTGEPTVKLLDDDGLFVRENFYVDDGLGCADTPTAAANILTEAVAALAKKRVRLHKIVATHPAVLDKFRSSEKATPAATNAASAGHGVTGPSLARAGSEVPSCIDPACANAVCVFELGMVCM